MQSTRTTGLPQFPKTALQHEGDDVVIAMLFLEIWTTLSNLELTDDQERKQGGEEIKESEIGQNVDDDDDDGHDDNENDSTTSSAENDVTSSTSRSGSVLKDDEDDDDNDGHDVDDDDEGYRSTVPPNP